MFNNVALGVVIGLVFIYLLYSLLATVIQEFIAQILDLRSKMLVKTIRTLLDDRKETDKYWLTRWARNIWNNIYHYFCPLCGTKFSKAFYTHPSIKYLAQSSWKSKPSYISSDSFSSTIIKLLRGKEYDGTEPQMNAIYRTLYENAQVIAGQSGKNQVISTIEPESLENLKQLYVDAQKDIDRFKGLIEKWYNETSERATGWYKKQTQIILLVLGFILAIAFNADTITIGKILSKDKDARDQLVNMATRSVGKYDSLVQKMVKVHLVDSTLDVRRLSTAAGDTTTDSIWRRREYDTLLMNTDQLKETYKIVMADIENANSILGLGYNWKDSCVKTETIKDSIKNSSIPEKDKKILLQLLETDCGKKLFTNDECKSNRKWLQWHPLQTGGIATIIGWLLTAFAISLGAPFWFDILNKVVQLRSSVAQPKETDTGGGSSKMDDNKGSSTINRVG